MHAAPAFKTVGTIDQFGSTGFIFAELSQATQALVGGAFAAGKRFFAAPAPEKMTSRLPLDAGFRPHGIEYSSSNAHPDEVESFTFSARSAASDVALMAGVGAELHAVMASVFGALVPSIATVVRDLAAECRIGDLPSLEESIGRWSILQMNFSRPSETAAEFINDEHEDGCLLTAMVSTGPGLEMRASDGTYTPVVADPRRLVLASGEILWLLTGGDVAPAYHRVRPTEGLAERLSLLLFADVGPELCSPWKSSTLNAGVDIGERVLTNATRFGLDVWGPA